MGFTMHKTFTRTREIFSCQTEDNKQLVSTSSCSGGRTLGHIYKDEPSTGEFAPLYLCYRQTTDNHFLSHNQNCEGSNG